MQRANGQEQLMWGGMWAMESRKIRVNEESLTSSGDGIRVHVRPSFFSVLVITIDDNLNEFRGFLSTLRRLDRPEWSFKTSIPDLGQFYRNAQINYWILCRCRRSENGSVMSHTLLKFEFLRNNKRSFRILWTYICIQKYDRADLILLFGNLGWVE